jgi:hypothetical protein
LDIDGKGVYFLAVDRIYVCDLLFEVSWLVFYSSVRFRIETHSSFFTPVPFLRFSSYSSNSLFCSNTYKSLPISFTFLFTYSNLCARFICLSWRSFVFRHEYWSGLKILLLFSFAFSYLPEFTREDHSSSTRVWYSVKILNPVYHTMSVVFYCCFMSMFLRVYTRYFSWNFFLKLLQLTDFPLLGSVFLLQW